MKIPPKAQMALSVILGLSFVGAAWGAEHYVAPGGSPSGDGSVDRPWDLQTALNQPASVRAGDTIWLRNGVYGHNTTYSSKLTGTSTQPIIVRQYHGDRATVDGGFMIYGAYTWFWGFEVEGTVTKRITGLSGSDGRPPNFPDGFGVYAPGSKFINLIVHDTAQGFSFWTPAIDAELYGNLIYNNGWYGTDRGHGHGIYTQNNTGTKVIADNIIFQGFGLGIQCYGSSAAYIKNFVFDGNTIFNSGTLTGKHDYNLLVAGGGNAGGPQNITVTNNYTYHTPSDVDGRSALSWGFDSQASNLTATNNYWIGGAPAIELNLWKGATFANNIAYTQGGYTLAAGKLSSSTYTWTNNKYYGPVGMELDSRGQTFADWRSASGLDANSTFAQGPPKGVWVFVRPNRYEPGRANITIYNWSLANSVSVDLSKVLTVGRHFAVLNAQDFFVAPVVSATYNGGSIAVPMIGLTEAQPHGTVPAAPKSVGPQFGAFVVLQQ